ncbi:CapA family protein [Streptomyces sp. APSN-46.1]|uniref:CapA family protein n=1 Tax=Streptomyces sp. APSN-46.1 TaxID=2929049 RepID=UPI001FB269CA|nr:CapA family protein [Streptomyces sp. APSN-46.1]MCJ1676062.1 CapA family protein [Streptomyces sp. APSN-46.1]
MGGERLLLCLCGDVMLGRGIDQILPHPGDPALEEAYVRDARTYVELAEAVGGALPQRPVGFSWPWGEALKVLDAAAPDVRILNLETSVTRSDESTHGKAVLYRMHPANLPCLLMAHPDVCVLANNHVLDYGRSGLGDTLDALAAAGLRTAGAGRNLAEAQRPAAVPLADGTRVVVHAVGMASSGIPPGWAATAERSGVAFAAEASQAAAAEVVERMRSVKRPGDLTVVSVHWGSNWGYGVPRDQVRCAHALIDGGADVVHGHSSHHPRPMEVYRGRFITYGCGDLVNDYEGIGGYEEFRDDLRLLYLVAVDPGTGLLQDVRVVPLRSRRLRLCRASDADSRWLDEVLARICRGFGARVGRDPDGTLRVTPAADGPALRDPPPGGRVEKAAEPRRGGGDDGHRHGQPRHR